jgi:hypothetical protein
VIHVIPFTGGIFNCLIGAGEYDYIFKAALIYLWEKIF